MSCLSPSQRWMREGAFRGAHGLPPKAHRAGMSTPKPPASLHRPGSVHKTLIIQNGGCQIHLSCTSFSNNQTHYTQSLSSSKSFLLNVSSKTLSSHFWESQDHPPDCSPSLGQGRYYFKEKNLIIYCSLSSRCLMYKSAICS